MVKYKPDVWVEVDLGDDVKVKGQCVHDSFNDGLVTVLVNGKFHRFDLDSVTKIEPPALPEPDYRELVYNAIKEAHNCGPESECLAAQEITDEIDKFGPFYFPKIYKALGEGLVEKEVDSW